MNRYLIPVAKPQKHFFPRIHALNEERLADLLKNSDWKILPTACLCTKPYRAQYNLITLPRTVRPFVYRAKKIISLCHEIAGGHTVHLPCSAFDGHVLSGMLHVR
ncbi:MAG: hypothetical protein LBR86_07120, partial [Tannerella sp.]|nr:hypothetical protein [Tannerella sp.]